MPLTLSAAGLFLAAAMAVAPAPAPVLVIADEIPAMQALADGLKDAPLAWEMVLPPGMPADLTRFGAVVVYIHRDLPEAVEKACLRYAEGGGRLVLLHHSISSGKRKNAEWLPALGVSLPQGDVSQGGYKYIEGITMQLVNLAPRNPVTSRNVPYPEQARWQAKRRPAFTLEDTEVYLNHVLSGKRTVLLGLIASDPKSGVTYRQATAGWFRRLGRGWVVYLMAGHSRKDFDNPSYRAIVRNALTLDLAAAEGK